MMKLLVRVWDRRMGGIQTEAFSEMPILIGSDPMCKILRADPALLEVHGALHLDDDVIIFTPTAGAESFLNWEPIPPAIPTRIPEGVLLLLGHLEIDVRVSDGTLSPDGIPSAEIPPVPSVRAPIDFRFSSPIVLKNRVQTMKLPEATPDDKTEVEPIANLEAKRTLPVQPGLVLAQYKLERLIGEGGMGAVYEATHTGVIEKHYALKVLSAEISSHPQAEPRFLAEAAVASRLTHPHIVSVTDFGSSNGVSYLVMEYLEGETLGQRLRRKPLSIERACDYLIAVASGVVAAHDKGIIHRDLKPDNIFLAATETDTVPKILDFGIAKRPDTDTNAMKLSRTGGLLGTPNYLSPEQAKYHQPANARSDQYALGAILYECVTGRVAHEGPTLYAILHSIAEASYPSPSQLNSAIPEALEWVIQKAMCLDPEGRYPSVKDFGRALLPFISQKRQAIWGFYFRDNRVDESNFQGALISRTVASAAVAGHTKLSPQEAIPRLKRVTNREQHPPKPRRLSVLWLVLLAAVAGALLSAAAVGLRRNAPAEVVPQP
jgi:eukaryotic-like serine/threonine-protein kinase